MIGDARDSAQQEGKSSAGDKYETGRAMMHLEEEKYGQQLMNANRVRNLLNAINPASTSEKVRLGSVVITTLGNYFISISAGRIPVGEQKYFAISPQAPLAQELWGKQAGDTVMFNDKPVLIQEVF